MELEEGPEIDDEGVDFVIGPEAVFLRGEGLVDDEPFGGMTELLRQI